MAPLRPRRSDPWLLEHGLWQGGTSTSHVPRVRGALRDIQQPTAAAGAGHQLGRTGKSLHQLGEGHPGERARPEPRKLLVIRDPCPSAVYDRGGGEGVPLPAKGPKGTFGEDGGHSRMASWV